MAIWTHTYTHTISEDADLPFQKHFYFMLAAVDDKDNPGVHFSFFAQSIQIQHLYLIAIQ